MVDGEELHRRGHVVHADDGGAVPRRPGHGGEAAGQPLGGSGAGDPADEALAAGADEQRSPQAGERVEAAQQQQVVARALGEADPGVEDDLRAIDDAGSER